MVDTIIDKSKLLNASGARLGKAMFIEFDYVYESRIAVYTLAREDKTVDGVVYPSLFRLYMQVADSTEAEFVRRYMFDLKQWEQLCLSPFFRDEVQMWRKELRLMKLGQAVASLEEDVNKNTNSSSASAKFLIEKVYRLSGEGRGRPSNTKKIDDTKLFEDSVEEDIKRILSDDAT